MRRPVKWIVGDIVVLGLAHPLPIGVIGPEFREDERLAIVEYLKIHRDLPGTPPDYQPPQCRLNAETL